MSNAAILIVDDNPDDVELTLRALRKNKVANEVVVAGDGEEALEAVHGAGAMRPSLILLDVNLPGLSGFEVLERLRGDERTARVPVVMLTSSADDRDVADAYDYGVNSYVRKPVDFTEFIEVARQIGMYWLLVNRAPAR